MEDYINVHGVRLRKALESGTTIVYLIALCQLRDDKQRGMHLREIRGRDGPMSG